MEPGEKAAEKLGEAEIDAAVKLHAAAIEAARKVSVAAAKAGRVLDEGQPNPPDPVDEDRVRVLVREILTHDLITTVAKISVKETLLQLGIDTSDPIAMQKDFIHLREWRGTVEGIRSKSIMTLTTLFVTGVLGAVVWSFKDLLHLPK